MLFDITWFGAVYAQRFMKSVSCSKQGYASITCSKIENIPCNLIFITKFNDYYDFNYDYFIAIFKFVCWYQPSTNHNTNPGYQV
jgi:hypothetical protein